MNKPIAIIAGEPNSISSEIIFKTWRFKKKFAHKKFFIIGSVKLLNLQKKKLKFKIKIKSINQNFKSNDISGVDLPVLNVDYIQKKPFENISNKSNSYIFKCFDESLKLIKDKKISGIINCPINKESLLKKKYLGITEYLSSKLNKKSNEVMLIYNKKLSVSPITTHIPISQVSKKIDEKIIIKKVRTINSFYKKVLKRKPKFAILGLNPHNFSIHKKNEEKIIRKAVNKLTKFKIKVVGPISSDSSFAIYEKHNFDIIIGMYHDQVLVPFKALFKFKAINITLGLPFVRISPDHGVASNIMGKNISNEISLVESIKFFNYIK